MMNSSLILTCIILPVTFLLHLMNNILIISKKHLHKPSYYILVNLSISDMFLLIVVATRFSNAVDPNNFYLDFSHKVVAMASVLSTLCMTLDRYVAVVYCLRYSNIMNKSFLILLLCAVWVSSFILAMIPFLLSDEPEKRRLYGNCILVPVFIVSCIILIFASLWIRRIRNLHITNIKKRRIYFGVQEEKLSTLQNLKASILDLFKLNYVTAILLLNAEVFRMIMIYQFRSKNVPINIIVGVFSVLYVVTNPVVYIMSMRDLKKIYKEMICCFRKQDGDSMTTKSRYTRRFSAVVLSRYSL